MARGARQSEFPGPLEEPLTVERDGIGATVCAREQVRAKSLRAVVPDLRPVQRHNHRLVEILREAGADFREQAVAVDVDHVRALEDRARLAADPDCAGDRSGAKQALQRRPLGARDPGHVRCLWQRSTGGRMRYESHGVAPSLCPLAEMKWQQRVRGLIGRQVRREVDDSHAMPNAYCRLYAAANSANVAGSAFSVVRAKSKKRSSLSQNAFNSASVR